MEVVNVFVPHIVVQNGYVVAQMGVVVNVLMLVKIVVVIVVRVLELDLAVNMDVMETVVPHVCQIVGNFFHMFQRYAEMMVVVVAVELVLNAKIVRQDFV